MRTALSAEPAKRTEVQKYLADKFQKELRPDPATLPQLLADDLSRVQDEGRGTAMPRSRQRKRNARVLPEIRAFYDLPGEVTTPLLRRGDYTNPGREVPPGALSVLATAKPFTLDAAREGGPDERPPPGVRGVADATGSSADGPRPGQSALAASTSARGSSRRPTTSASKGDSAEPSGIARLAGDRVRRSRLEHQGDAPVDPDLDAPIASRAATSAEGKRLDPDNRLLWRQRLRRIDAEVLRDRC